MRRPGIPVIGSWLVHAIAWLSPVHADGERLPGTLPGWQAFRVAFSPVWRYEGFSADTGYGAAISSASALTNLVMLASVPVVLRGSARARAVLGWTAAGSAVLNAQWFLAGGRAELRIGYYLWWFSFVLLTAGVFGPKRGDPRGT